MNERIGELLAIAQRKQRKPTVPQPPPPPAALDAAAKKAFDERPKAPPLPEKPARVSSERARPSGRKALPAHLEVDAHALRPLNVLFAGSTEGAHRACVVLGIVATCRAIGVPVQAYLAWAFERLGTHRDLYGLEIQQIT